VLNTIFLTVEQVLVIHDDQIERYGGSHGIANLSLLESAVMRPQTTFAGADLYPAVFDKATALMHSLVMNHAFVDGNKRTATVLAVVFLEMNGHKLQVGQKELIKAALNVRHKRWNVKKLSSWLKAHSKRRKKV
jgi:death-on-curing protein